MGYLLKGEERRALRRVRKLVAGTHWIQGSYERVRGEKYRGRVLEKDCWCLVGCVNKATGCGWMHAGSGLDLREDTAQEWLEQEARTDTLRRRILAALGCAIRARGGSVRAIENWNDYNKRTREDVLALIDEALELKA